MLDMPEWEFKKDLIALAGDDFRANSNTAARLGLVFLAMAVLMAAEAACFLGWSAQVVPSVRLP
jgi:hypothetical protein